MGSAEKNFNGAAGGIMHAYAESFASSLHSLLESGQTNDTVAAADAKQGRMGRNRNEAKASAVTSSYLHRRQGALGKNSKFHRKHGDVLDRHAHHVHVAHSVDCRKYAAKL